MTLRLPLILLLLLSGCTTPPATLTLGAPTPHTVRVMPASDRPAELVGAGVLPRQDLTPGAYFADVTIDDVRKDGFSATVRDVTEAEKRKVFELYGLDYERERSKREADHVIELAVGGANDIRNIWPQQLHLNYHGRDMGAIEKDKLEKKVLAAVRAGKMSLHEAQAGLAGDWTVLYRKMVAAEFPVFVEVK
jgi:hypothetical protein